MKKKTSRPLLTAGTSTLLLIFLSLCLLTFAVLSLLSARADRNLSRKAADRTTAYYEACNQAENRIGEIDGILEKIWKNTEGEEMYFQEIEIHFEDAENSESETGNSITGNSIYSWDSASRTLSFSVPLADTQVLAVSLTLRYPEVGGTFYTVTSWKTVNTADWTPDTRQNVYVQTETAEKGTDKTYE